MSNSKLIDKLQIGAVAFEAYIIIDENNLEAFAIYFQDVKEPLIIFQQDPKNKHVEIKVNQQLVKDLHQLKSNDSAQRKEHYKIFQEFALNAEQQAKEIAFQDKKLHYVTDIELLKSLEQAYLID